MNAKVIKYLNKHINEDFSNKTIIITGGNSGIGLEVAKICAYLNMHVIIAVRSLERGAKAIEAIKKENESATIEMMKLDVSEEQSIKDFANKIKEKKIDIDYFYHNAGVYRLPYELKEGRELVVSTNYFGPFILSSLLLDYLHSLNHEVSMIFTSSIAAKYARNKVDFLYPNEKISRTKRYCNSKLLDAHLFRYLFENDKSNIKYNLVHPGVTRSALFEKAYKSKSFIRAANNFIQVFGNPIYKSALATILAMSKQSESGLFYGPIHFFNVIGYPHKNRFLNRKYKNTNNFIQETEKIVDYKLLK